MFEKYRAFVRDNPKGYWFKRKWFGWGWTPVTWQGWLVTAVYAAIVVFFASSVENAPTQREVWLVGVLPIVVATVLFIRIALAKGESPRWQWGSPKQRQKEETP